MTPMARWSMLWSARARATPSFCASYSVLGGPDSLSADAHLAHALVVLNGNCAQTSAQLPDLQYHLVRTLGRVLGLDGSQVNVNVVTGIPAAPTAADYAGFPLMHARGSHLLRARRQVLSGGR